VAIEINRFLVLLDGRLEAGVIGLPPQRFSRLKGRICIRVAGARRDALIARLVVAMSSSSAAARTAFCMRDNSSSSLTRIWLYRDASSQPTLDEPQHPDFIFEKSWHFSWHKSA
jgi:hypothetical protein